MRYLKNMNTFGLSLGMVILLCLLVFTNLTYTQTRTHSLGDYKYRVESNDYINTNEVEATGEWPQGVFRYATIVFYNSGFAVGNWIDAAGGNNDRWSALDAVSYNEAEPYGIKEYRRFDPPKVYVYSEGQLLESSRPFNGEIDPNYKRHISKIL